MRSESYHERVMCEYSSARPWEAITPIPGSGHNSLCTLPLISLPARYLTSNIYLHFGNMVSRTAVLLLALVGLAAFVSTADAGQLRVSLPSSPVLRDRLFCFLLAVCIFQQMRQPTAI